VRYGTVLNEKTLEPVDFKTDGLSAQRLKKEEKKEAFKDKVVW
jgi:hypothetical protein